MPCQKCLREDLSIPSVWRRRSEYPSAFVLAVFCVVISGVTCANAADVAGALDALPVQVIDDSNVPAGHNDAVMIGLPPHEATDQIAAPSPDAAGVSQPEDTEKQGVALPPTQPTAVLSTRRAHRTDPAEVFGSYHMAQSLDGRLVPSSISSRNYKDGSIQYCSFVARLNLEMLTGLPLYRESKEDPSEIIPPGDAIDMIAQGLHDGTLELLNPGRSSEAASNILEHFYKSTGKTIFEVYMHHTYMRHDFSTNAGHRFVVFLGNDNLWYVLDPTLGKTSDPIILADYLRSHTRSGDDVYLKPEGYLPADYIMKVEEGMIVLAEPYDIASLIMHDVLVPHYAASLSYNSAWVDSVHTTKPLRFLGNGIMLDLKEDTEFHHQNGDTKDVDMTHWHVGLYDGDDVAPWRTLATHSVVLIGDGDTPLIASKPMRVSIDLGTGVHGSSIELYQKIPGGASLVVGGISDSPDATCDGGRISDPQVHFQKNNEKLVFYICQGGHVFLQRGMLNFEKNNYATFSSLPISFFVQ